MRKNFMLAVILLCALGPACARQKTVRMNTSKSAQEIVREMGTGWNLGNTLDANATGGLESETSWGQPRTTKEMIDGIARAGFKTIRIPVSWSNHITGKNHRIDSAWLRRVKQIVDWAIEDGLYVILNCHHDNYSSPSGISYGDGYYPNPVCWNESMLFVKNLWLQIGREFNDGYDEHLIFEVLNEPRLRGHEHEWWISAGCNDCKHAAQTLNRLNQTAVDAIRSCGGNNAERLIMIPGLAAAPHSVLDSDTFTLPKDSADGRLILSVHIYAPYSFAMENPGEQIFLPKHENELKGTFAELNDRFIRNGIPVIIGEYGATNKNNTEQREAWFRTFITESRRYGMCACLWDNGDWNASVTYEEKFGFYNRTEQSWYFPTTLRAITESVGE